MRNAMQLFVAAAAVAILSAPASAQKHSKIPPGQRPPAGMCRIWIDGLPPGQQSAPTDCATAVARRPANARVIYGPNTRHVNVSNGSIVTVNGRQCIQRLDANGNAKYDCPTDPNKIAEAQRKLDEKAAKAAEKRDKDDAKRFKKNGKGKGDRDDRD